ncbi:acetylglutamate kinase [Fodinisporobacter ferrooxydans]|uniref:Acetylglutamate kinase n=1 Tax=Fodinisporobacter ferrooxydans TaxID=2901836 RepID=A0ABY4CPK6_9BACL|nr:acetylglutamate kinase [Alicyclobacillaceae bacterium MYW30-H2]
MHGEIVVIKYGGSSIGSGLADVIQDVLKLQQSGWKPVLVHGGGKDITSMLSRLQIEGKFVNGLRLTDAPTLDVVEMVLRGKVNLQLVAEIQKQGGKAIGLSGVDGGMIQVRQKLPELGFVGDVKSVATELLEVAVATQYIPVVAPIGMDAQGQRFNINADEAAGAIAGALQASRCIFLTDVAGVMRQSHTQSDGQPIVADTLTRQEIESMIASGEIYGGMIPKMEACLYALEAGAQLVQIVDGRKTGILAETLIEQLPHGTKIVA